MVHLLSILLVFFALLAFLILTHELGHFLMARWLGIKVDEFGFGLPPRVVGWAKFKNKEGKKYWRFVFKKKKKSEKLISTVYSLNAIPFGGFVKIMGEDGSDKDNRRSFAAQSATKRFLVLFAGIFMNFVFGSLLFSLGFWLGFPEMVDDGATVKDAKVQVSEVMSESPAELAGIKVGDTLRSVVLPNSERLSIEGIGQVQTLTKNNAGEKIIFEVLRGDDVYRLEATPRVNPAQGQGALGVSLVRTGIVRHSFGEALLMGPQRAGQLFWIIGDYIGGALVKLVRLEKTQMDFSGPVGIVVLTNQMKEMGWPYLLQFAAVISVNLAFMNLLPLPALDGGRILFLLIEKIKGRPVDEKIEGIVHTVGLYLLLFLMLVVSVKDVSRFQDKFKMLFERIGF